MSQATKISNPWDNIATNYDSEIISPLLHATHNPLWGDINKIKAKATKTVADLGAGTGNLMPYLLPKFKKIYAIDAGAKMVELMKEKRSRLKSAEKSKVKIYKKKLENLKGLENSFDLAISINSLLMPEYKNIKKSLLQIKNSLRKGGRFILVVPSMEAISQAYRWIYERELKLCGKRAKAITLANKNIEFERIHFGLGEYDTSDMIQKYFSRFEIETLLAETGFTVKSYDRVVYDGEITFLYNDPKPKSPNMWDHYLNCSVQ
ncbi:MAG: class I SAM-dependent methyltransferase [Bacteriovoracaceae bacterium]|jgi:SAM-dependent methyltransferase|nr:class I SAM-dependent methyltransferase [Bacteriovoracaceae bacterium]